MSNSALRAMTVNGLPAGQTSSSYWCKRSIAASAAGSPRSMPSPMPVRRLMNSGNGRCGSTSCSNLGLAFSSPGVTSNAPISIRGSFPGMESRGFRVKHHVRVERLVEWSDATWIISVDVAIPIQVSFPFTGSVLPAGSAGLSRRFPSSRSPGVIRPRGHAGRRRGWPG